VSDQATVSIEEYRRINAVLLDFYERQMSGSRAYTTLITGIGYAALVAIWNGSRSHLGPMTMMFSGALVGISLFIFVLFEIAKISALQRHEVDFFEGVEVHYGNPDFWIIMQEKHAEVLKKGAGVNRAQPYVFWISTITGFGAALWIIGSMIAGGLALWSSC
jgi:hypothetical protein